MMFAQRECDILIKIGAKNLPPDFLFLKSLYKLHYKKKNLQTKKKSHTKINQAHSLYISMDLNVVRTERKPWSVTLDFIFLLSNIFFMHLFTTKKKLKFNDRNS